MAGIYADPMTQPPEQRMIPCVGGIVKDAEGRLLLVKRGQEPAKGRWSVPGGRVELDESDVDATAREVLEETGVRVRVGQLVGTVERAAPGGGVYLIRDYLCEVYVASDSDAPDALRAGDDADDAGWFTPDEVRALDTSPGLVEALTEWGVL